MHSYHTYHAHAHYTSHTTLIHTTHMYTHHTQAHTPHHIHAHLTMHCTYTHIHTQHTPTLHTHTHGLTQPWITSCPTRVYLSESWWHQLSHIFTLAVAEFWMALGPHLWDAPLVRTAMDRVLGLRAVPHTGDSPQPTFRTIQKHNCSVFFPFCE